MEPEWPEIVDAPEMLSYCFRIKRAEPSLGTNDLKLQDTSQAMAAFSAIREISHETADDMADGSLGGRSRAVQNDAAISAGGCLSNCIVGFVVCAQDGRTRKASMARDYDDVGRVRFGQPVNRTHS